MSHSRATALKRIFGPSKEVYSYFRSVLAPVLWETVCLFICGWHGPKRAPRALPVMRRLGMHLVRETREFLQKEFAAREPGVRQDLLCRAQLIRSQLSELVLRMHPKRVQAHNSNLERQIRELMKRKALCRKHQRIAQRWVNQRQKLKKEGLYHMQYGRYKYLQQISEMRSVFSEQVGYTVMAKLSPLSFSQLDIVRFKYSSHLYIRYHGILIRATRVMDKRSYHWHVFRRYASVKLNAQWRNEQLRKALNVSTDRKYLRDLGATPAQMRAVELRILKDASNYTSALQRMSKKTAKGGLRSTPLKKLKERRSYR